MVASNLRLRDYYRKDLEAENRKLNKENKRLQERVTPIDIPHVLTDEVVSYKKYIRKIVELSTIREINRWDNWKSDYYLRQFCQFGCQHSHCKHDLNGNKI